MTDEEFDFYAISFLSQNNFFTSIEKEESDDDYCYVATLHPQLFVNLTNDSIANLMEQIGTLKYEMYENGAYRKVRICRYKPELPTE